MTGLTFDLQEQYTYEHFRRMRNKDKFLLHLYNTNRLVDYSYEILFLSEIYDHMPFYLIFYLILLHIRKKHFQTIKA